MLSPERRQQLDGIVLDMAKKNASPEQAQLIVNDFKRKFENEGVSTTTPVSPGMESPEPTTFGGKVAEFGKDIVRDITKPIVQSLAAPAQLAAYGIDKATGGNSPVEDFSFTMPFWGEISPAQTNQEAIGRGMKTVAAGAGPVSGGALFMGGDAMEQNKSATSVALNTAGGAIAGKVGELALKGVGTVMSKTGSMMQTAGAGKDALLKSAMKNYETVLGPTTKANKRTTQQITSELAEREVTATTRKELFEKAGENVEKYGEEITEFYRALPENTKVQTTHILRAIDAVKKKLFVQGEGAYMVPEVNKALFKKYQDLQIEIMSMAKNGNAPIEGIRALRQALDKSIAKTTSTFGITGEETIITEARKGVSNILRGELAKQFPDIAVINKEFTFWSRVQQVLGDTIERKTGQGMPIGDKIMTAAGFAGGFGSGGVSSAIGYAITLKWLGEAVKSAAWQTTSASIKTKMAKALSEGDSVLFKELVNGVLKASGYVLEKSGNFLKATPGVLKNAPRKDIPGTRQINLKSKAKTILDNVKGKGGLSIQNVSKTKNPYRNKTFFHGSGEDIFKNFDDKKTPSYGLSLSLSEKEAGRFGDVVSSVKLPEKTKIMSKGEVRKYYLELKKQTKGNDDDFALWDLVGGKDQDELMKYAKKQGYDAVDLTGSNTFFPSEEEIRIVNPSIFTKAKETALSQKKSELTTKLLKDIDGKAFVSKQYMLDATNRPELKQVEKDLIRDLLETEGDKIDVPAFTQKVDAELLPLKVNSSGLQGNKNPVNGKKLSSGFQPKYENVSLPDELRGDVKNYKENIYESPIATSAGETHFAGSTKNYFGHTRVEDMAPEYKVGNTTYRSKSEAKVFGDNPIEQPKTRRVIEVQSDLYQKGRLEREIGDQTNGRTIQEAESYVESIGKDTPAGRSLDKAKELSKLQQYGNPTAHFRMVREEIKRAADDGVEKLQFPTGETGMKIEGLGDTTEFALTKPDEITKGEWRMAGKLTPENVKVGQSVVSVRGGDEMIVTNVLENGKFKAMSKSYYNEIYQPAIKSGEGENEIKRILSEYTEEFDISGKIDESNPIYKFYEKELGKYLKNKYKAELVTDKQGVTWMEVTIKPEHKGPVEAFGKARVDTILAGAAGTGALSAGVAGLKTLLDTSTTKTFENPPLKKNEERKPIETILAPANDSLGSFKHDETVKKLANWTDGEASHYYPLDENQTRKGTDGTGAYGRKVKKGSIAFGNRYFQEALKKGAEIYVKVQGMEDVVTPYGKGVFRVDDTMNQRYSQKGKFNIDFHPDDLDESKKKKGRFPIKFKIVEIKD